MRILGFNRVELLMAPEDIHEAAERFNDLLGTSFAPPSLVAGGEVLTTTDWDNHVELYGPSGPESRIASSIAEKGRGAIGPLVWEVANIDEARDYVLGRGHRIQFEYQEDGVKQIILDPDEWYGYLITFIERAPS
jgi:catechol 2,3-dioxygenase-like lactoylglutathione lyase family enzyme